MITSPSLRPALNAYKEAYQTGSSSGTNGTALLRCRPANTRSPLTEKGRAPRQPPRPSQPAQTNHIEIELNPPPKITGVVRDPSGAAVPGLTLSVVSQLGSQ